MEAGARRHLERAGQAARQLGFDGTVLQREVRQRLGHPVWGWALVVARGHEQGTEVAFLLEPVLEDEGEAYVSEVERLLTVWARVDAALRRPAPPRVLLTRDLEDFAFLARHLVAAPPEALRVAELLLEHVELAVVAAAFRQAFGAGEGA